MKRQLYKDMDELINLLNEQTVNYERAERVAGKIMQNASVLKNQYEIGEYLNSKCCCDNVYANAWLYSFIVTVSSEPIFLEYFIDFLLADDLFSYQQLYFISCQINSKVFLDARLCSQKVLSKRRDLLCKIRNMCVDELEMEIVPIPKEELNDGLSVVIIGQMLSVQHGPTKTTVDRCRVLSKMGKKVFVINTAETLTPVGYIPLFDVKIGNYVEKYLEANELSWGDTKFTYFQCEQTMPNTPDIKALLQTIISLKPGMVFYIGTGSLFAGLVDMMVPVVTIGLTSSGMVTTLTKYQVVEEMHLKISYENVAAMGIPKEHIIPGVFTFTLKDKEQTITRKEVNIPEDVFVIAIIGARLDYEITNEFVELLERIAIYNIKIVFIGSYLKYNDLIKEYPLLREKSVYWGFVKDMLSRIEICDIYLNPPRTGGGTSAVEAMYMGKPVVTLDGGDVAGVVRDTFICGSYEDMLERIVNYITDKDFYEIHSKIAKEKAKYCMDAETEFKKVIDIYRERELS